MPGFPRNDPTPWTDPVVLGKGLCPLKSPHGSGLRYHRRRIPTPQPSRFAMNAFIEHHQPMLRLDYSCFDRILRNAIIQVLQYPASVVGFLEEKRRASPLNPAYFRTISTRASAY